MKPANAAELERLRRAAEDYQARRETVIRISKSLDRVSLRTLSIFAEAKQQIGRRA